MRQVVNELRGEKVDVVQWRDDIGQFIAEALGPAKVKEVQIDEERPRPPTWSCPSISFAGHRQEGQNARLAARLSGYKVDIRSDMEGVEVEDPVPRSGFVRTSPVPRLHEAEAEVTEEAAAAEVSVEEAVDTDVPASDDEDAVAAVDNGRRERIGDFWREGLRAGQGPGHRVERLAHAGP